MKKLFAVVLTAIMAITVVGCSVTVNTDKTSTQEKGTVTQSNAPEKTSTQEKGTVVQSSVAEEVKETEAPKEETAVKPGNYIQGEKYKFSFLSAKQYDEIAENEYFTNTPENGKKYLVLFFEVENVSDKSEYVNSLYMEAYVDDYGVDSSFIMSKLDGYDYFSGGDLAPGKKMKGFFAYEVNPDWKIFEITYKELLDKESYNFKVTPGELS